MGIIREDGSVEKRKESMIKERGILDFGDGYLLYKFLEKTNIFPLLSEMIKEHPEIISLIIYRYWVKMNFCFLFGFIDRQIPMKSEFLTIKTTRN